MSEALGNRADEVRVSAGTRAMSRGEGFGDTLEEVTAHRDALVVRRRQIDARLGALNDTVRGRGRQRLDSVAYRRICDEQAELKTEIVEVDARLREVNKVYKELAREQYERARSQPGPTEIRLDRIEKLLIRILEKVEAR